MNQMYKIIAFLSALALVGAALTFFGGITAVIGLVMVGGSNAVILVTTTRKVCQTGDSNVVPLG
jgi:hypothetical protein